MPSRRSRSRASPRESSTSKPNPPPTRSRIEISDNGPGIPKGLWEKIFDPFFTTKQVGKGTGQGLALAKDFIVNQHGGKLLLDSRPGFSTTFVIELPLKPPTSSQTRQPVRNAQA